MLKSLSLFFVCLFFMVNISADTSIKAFLVGQSKNSSGETLCRYDNGTVINIGLRLICPMSIPK